MKGLRLLFSILMMFNVAYASLDLNCLSEKENCTFENKAGSDCEQKSTHSESRPHQDHCPHHCTAAFAVLEAPFQNFRYFFSSNLFLSYQFHYVSILLESPFQPPKV